MTKESKRTTGSQRIGLMGVIAVCLLSLVVGALFYFRFLNRSLEEQLAQNVTSVTTQQQQALDRFITNDQERIHSYVEYFSKNPIDNSGQAREMLSLFAVVDAEYTVLCLDEGWACSSRYGEIHRLDREQMAEYGSLSGRGVRNGFTAIFSGTPKFGYYETFTYAGSGHRGVIQKGYDRNRIQETFSLSFYDDQGYTFVVDQKGDILMRPAVSPQDWGGNIFDAMVSKGGDPETVEQFRQRLQNDETGAVTLQSAQWGETAFTYIPMESVDGWFMVSVVPVDAVRNVVGEILQMSRAAVVYVGIILILGIVFVILISRTQRELSSRDRKIRYQSRLFSVLTDYISRCTDDVYLMVEKGASEPEFLSGNAQRVLGVSPEGIIPRLQAMDRERDRESAMHYDAIYRALRPGGASVSRMVERIDPRTGSRQSFMETVDCVEIEGKEKRLVYISDRTREKKERDALADALETAKAANEAKSRFMNGVSHDIRTPMNAVVGFATLLDRDAYEPEKVREYARKISISGQHLLGLINDILDISRIESGRTALNLSSEGISDWLKTLDAIIRPQMKAKGHTFEEYSNVRHESVKMDKLRMNQILLNLLSNAVKYTPAGGRVSLTVQELYQVNQNVARYRFIVEDNGYGMSEEYQEKIFQPFTREEDAVARHIQGTGLGMVIVKNLVDLMNGTIAVESKKGVGSAFTVELDLPISEADLDLSFWKKHRISKMLVVDDEEVVCQNIQMAMEGTQVSVEYSLDGQTGLDMVKQSKQEGSLYDIVLLDWKMPGMDGVEVAGRIRKEVAKKIPILTLTGYDWMDIEAEARAAGVDAFLSKPFFLTSFRKAMDSLLNHPVPLRSEPGKNCLKGLHILVAEDNEVNVEVITELLDISGASCEVYENGQAAVDAFAQSAAGQYQLILMDVQMPVLNGYQATRHIRSLKHPMARKIPIIAMTASVFTEDVHAALQSGMNAHVAKPIDMGVLEQTVRSVLEADSAALQAGPSA